MKRMICPEKMLPTEQQHDDSYPYKHLEESHNAEYR